MALPKDEIVRRRRLTRQERQRLLARYHRSQSGQREFAQRCGISVSTLVNWLKEERAAGQPAVSFQEVMLPGAPPRWALEVVSPQGWTVRLQQASDIPSLQLVLRALPC
jgi:transposase-like protein